MSEATMAQGRQVSLWTKGTYGFGAAAYGIKNNGFDYFFPDFLQSGDGGKCLLGEFGAADRPNV